ncbi:MAG: threonine synthase [Treponema sp. GWB1_62_6]|nr:MAG: threonine synthase [Treponema sp. GWA1_62_8]OHE62656.1 MAG: threonine synthase [Treponema sp. GWC1_61_84]OHE71559.1 MAG: threonine synthase [Treponema sp. GWB1_62_6]OHE76132.1 MAG: threonine synthase [Treponema sp. RIFOXYC1_FULL_61_9]HCM26651.1 threonine synthase [Treponema sp.]
MRYYSTRDKEHSVDFATAALKGLAADGGLYVPESVPLLPASVRSSLATMDFRDVAYETARPFVGGCMSAATLRDLVQDAYPFGAPLVAADDRFVLELFHGPTAAFKDFGARFMARAFAYFRRGEDRPLRILVATSGDTGGAVADGFFGVEGIEVTVLYPKGRVSPLQERQIAGLGGNISALSVEGSFDDCQALVKRAFADPELSRRLSLSSANSINISRLVPQAVYYVAAAGKAAAGKADEDGEATPRVSGYPAPRRESAGGKAVFCVPSGNFGNLTAGLYARAMGAPIDLFVAATNANRTVPLYLETGSYEPRKSVPTLSNAMDVGAPSNFERMTAHWSHLELSRVIKGVWTDDAATKATIERVHSRFGYILDPHGAVGWNALDELKAKGEPLPPVRVLLATAHPAKFAETVEPLVGPVKAPASLTAAMGRTVVSKTIPADFAALADSL